MLAFVQAFPYSAGWSVPYLVPSNRTALVEVEPGRAGARRLWLRKGRAGNLQTLLEMRRIIRESLGLDGKPENKQLSEVADNILRGWQITSGNEREICEAVHGFIFKNIGYVQDRAGGFERLQYPLETIRRGYGDCDDLEILEAALLGLCGIQDVWLEAAKYNPATEGEDHVYGFSKIQPSDSPNRDGILYHDSTASITEGKPLGWYDKDWIDYIRVPVFEDENNTLVSGFHGFWSTIISIGGIAAAPFTGGLSIPASQVGAGLVGQKEASGKQAKEIGKAFDDAASATVHLFDSIQHQTTITVDDYNRAAAALSALADIADKYPIDYITQHWNSAAYKQAFEERLEQIKQAATGGASVASNSAGASTQSQTQTTSAATTASTQSNLIAYVAIGVLALMIVPTIFRR